jgi:hypothetical protein
VQDLPLIVYAAVMALLVGVHASEVPEARDVVARHLLVALGYLGILRVLGRFKAPGVAVAWARTIALFGGASVLFLELSRVLPFIAGLPIGDELLPGGATLSRAGTPAEARDWLQSVEPTVSLAIHACTWLLPVIATVSLIPTRLADTRPFLAMLLGVSLAAFASCGLHLLVPGLASYTTGELPGIADVVPIAHAALALAAVLLLRRPRRTLFRAFLPLAIVTTAYCLWSHGAFVVVAGVALACGSAGIAAQWRDRDPGVQARTGGEVVT